MFKHDRTLLLPDVTHRLKHPRVGTKVSGTRLLSCCYATPKILFSSTWSKSNHHHIHIPAGRRWERKEGRSKILLLNVVIQRLKISFPIKSLWPKLSHVTIHNSIKDLKIQSLFCMAINPAKIKELCSISKREELILGNKQPYPSYTITYFQFICPHPEWITFKNVWKQSQHFINRGWVI